MSSGAELLHVYFPGCVPVKKNKNEKSAITMSVCGIEVCVLIHLITLDATEPVARLLGVVTMATG